MWLWQQPRSHPAAIRIWLPLHPLVARNAIFVRRTKLPAPHRHRIPVTFSAKPQAGQACAINGRPGRLVEGDDGELVCQPNDEVDRNRLDGMSLAELQQHRRQVTDVAYQEYSNWLSNQ